MAVVASARNTGRNKGTSKYIEGMRAYHARHEPGRSSRGRPFVRGTDGQQKGVEFRQCRGGAGSSVQLSGACKQGVRA